MIPSSTPKMVRILLVLLAFTDCVKVDLNMNILDEDDFL